MSLIDKIKKDVKKSGSNKSKIVYFKADSKVRIRFLQDAGDGLAITFHDSFALGINVPCQETFGKTCNFCDDEELRHRELYAWSVYDYDTNEVKILLAAASQFTPVPALIGMFEEYGTLLDRDYVITRTGAQLNTSYTVVPMDKAVFKNKKAKALSNKELLKIINKAYPPEQSEAGEDDGWDEDEEKEYKEMSPRELYDLCKEREIEAKPKNKKNYYIDLLEAADNAEYEEDDDDDDEW